MKQPLPFFSTTTKSKIKSNFTLLRLDLQGKKKTNYTIKPLRSHNFNHDLVLIFSITFNSTRLSLMSMKTNQNNNTIWFLFHHGRVCVTTMLYEEYTPQGVS